MATRAIHSDAAPTAAPTLFEALHPEKPPLYELHPDALLERQAAWESNARSYPRRLPLAIAAASGVFVRDTRGQQYLDCLAGAGALALGHNHPAVCEALRAALDSGVAMQTLDITTPLKDRFMERLLGLLPRPFASRARLQFCGPAGADAVEAALKLLKTATGRRPVLAFQGAYHGMTHGALALMGNLGAKTPIPGLMPEVHFLPYPYDLRSPFGRGEVGYTQCTRYLEALLLDPESGVPRPAGVFVELVQGEGGNIPAPDAWSRQLRDVTARHDVPLVVDEIQTGFGRTGAMFSCEHAGVTPDVMLLSKAIGGGLPLAVVAYDRSLDKWQPGAHAGTFRGNQLAMAAGLATMEYLERHDLAAHAARMGERLMGQLRELSPRFPCIAEVRGRGLMVGVELVDPGASDALGFPAAAPELARAVQREALRRGLIVELGGRHGAVVRFLPPLIIEPREIDFIAAVMKQALAAATETVRAD
jgi:diaminobutyrate-2-oxoglutarate transaminase